MLVETFMKVVEQPGRRLGRPFLIGFEASISADGFRSVTDDASDAARDFNFDLYRHPDRQTPKGVDKVRFQLP